MEGDSNRIVGNNNILKMESLSNNSSNPKDFKNIFVTGNQNTVTGDPDTSTAGDAGSVSDITVTGSKNTIQAKNQKNRNLTDIQIVGNQNTVDATTQNADLSNTQILGSHVTATLGNSVYLGSNSAYVVSGATTKGMDVYNSDGTYQYAGGTPAGIVTVGSAEKERRIQNVAAGLVSAKSTDAVNGSQLYTMTRPLRFAGDNSTIGTTSGSDVNVLHRGSDQAMSLLGGADSKNLSDKNIGVVANSTNNTLTVKLAKDVTGLNSITSKNVNAETVKAGDTTVNNQGVTIAGGPSVTKEGINANGTKITNVAAGTEDTDAVNVSQLTKQSADLTEKGFGLKDQDGNIVHKSLGKDIEVTGDGKNISTKVENGTMKVVLNDDLNVNSVTTADADGNQTVTQGSGMTVTDKDGNETTIGAGGITITPKNPAPGTSPVSLTGEGLDNGGNQIHNVAAGTAGTDAVNVNQLQDEIAKNATKLADGKNTTVTGTGTTENPYKVNVNDNLNLGEKGENGIDGSIGVTGKDGSAVTINGRDGSIGMNGKDGKDGLTMKSAKGQDGVDGANGMTRIVYEDDGHVTHEVATLDDGLKFAGNTGSVAKKLNSTMTIKGNGTKADTEYDASNIKTVVDAQGDLVIGLDKNLKADTVTVGGQGKDGADGINGAIGVKGADGKDGVTISSIGKDGTNGTDGHIGINGKDGASADIHVVKGANGVDGTDGYNGTDGIDRIVYEDHNGNTQTVATMNDGMKYGGDVGNVINKKLNGQVNVVGGITDSSKLSTEDNIGVVSDGSDNLKVRLSKDLKGLDSVTTKTVTADTGNITTVNASTVNVGDTTITTGGMTIQNGSAGQDVTLNKDGLDNGGNQIHNVAAGTAGTDAVNVNQLQDEIAKNATKLADGKNTTVTGTGTTENPYKVNVNDNLNLGEKGENGIDGSIGVTGKDGSAVTINGRDGSIGMNGKDGKDGLTMKSAKGQDGVDGANGMTRIVYEDDGHVTHEVATLDDGLKFAGNTGSVAKKLNSTMTIKGNGTKADTEYDASNIKTVVDAQGDLVIGLDKNLKADTVTVGGQGKDGADGINGAIGVKGADGKDGVTISSIGKDGTNGTDGHIGINGKDGASADIHVVKGANGVDGTDGYNGTDGIDRIVYEDHNGNTQTVATMNDGMKYGGDVGNVINKKLNGQVNVVGGITDSSKLSTEDNIGVVSDGSDNLKVRLSKDLKGLDSVTTKTVTADTGNITTVNASTVNVGDTTITTGGMTIQNGSAGQDVTLNKDGLNNGGNKITNVAPGDISSTSTDAVNGSQLYGTETRINRLGNRINHVGAGAAALAGLHPLDFDPDDKWDFAAGYGNYKNANAVAIGAYYRPNEDTMFSVGGSFSGGENMVNVGVSWKFGQKSHISRSRVSMAKDMLAMKNQIETLTKKLAAYESGQPVKLAPIATGAMTFPDVPENHWAYEYVKNLAERGYLKGYPDGEFKGDRAMTRYEYAAIIYRALQNGAPSDGNMTRSVDDFGPELVKVQNIDRFRVDRISGKDNDRHKVERVRVNDKDDKAQNVYRDVYGNHIQK